MYTALIVLHAITCLLLIGVVLIQSSKGAGLSGVFAADGGDSFMGASTGNFLTKLTSMLAVIFMITASALAFLSVKRQRSVMASAPLAVSEAQKQVFKQQLAQKLQEIKEQSEKASPAEMTEPLPDTPAAAPTVDDMMNQEQTLSVAVPELKSEKDIAAEEEAALAEQVKALEAEQNSEAPDSEELADSGATAVQEKEIEAALARAQKKAPLAGGAVTEEQNATE